MKHRTQSGFTIIEILLVLAIAGLIFLMFFNVLPTLIRNGHNNQRKQDVTTILSAISHYQLNHSGTYPPDSLDPAFSKGLKLSFYKLDEITFFIEIPPLTHHVVSTVDSDEVQVYNYHLCNTANPGATDEGAGYRDMAALYNIEVKGSLSVKCQQL